MHTVVPDCQVDCSMVAYRLGREGHKPPYHARPVEEEVDGLGPSNPPLVVSYHGYHPYRDMRVWEDTLSSDEVMGCGHHVRRNKAEPSATAVDHCDAEDNVPVEGAAVPILLVVEDGWREAAECRLASGEGSPYAHECSEEDEDRAGMGFWERDCLVHIGHFPVGLLLLAALLEGEGQIGRLSRTQFSGRMTFVDWFVYWKADRADLQKICPQTREWEKVRRLNVDDCPFRMQTTYR